MDSSVSVIIPTYNRAGLVARAIKSALAATVPGDEVIVIDDGSTDDTPGALRPFYDKIRYFHTANSGPGSARNMGIQLARHPLVAFLDSDDEWLPDKLYVQRAVMCKFPHVLFCFTDLLAQRPDGEIVHNILDVWRHDERVGYGDAQRSWDDILRPGIPFSLIARLPEGRADFAVHTGDIYPTLMEAYYVWTCSIMVRKEFAGASFRFPEDQNICEDWECFARLAKVGPAAYLNCETAVQHVHHHDRRLTDVTDSVQATARIQLLHRVWGADESFLINYSYRYQSVLKAQHFRRARYLIKEGRLSDAKEELRTVGGGPWSYRLLITLPAPVIRSLIGVRRQLMDRG